MSEPHRQGQGRKVAIVGTCPSSRGLALDLPADWELWVCAVGNEAFPRIDLWFELHGDLDFPCEGGRWQRYLDWLNLQGFPVLAQDQRLIPRAKAFPVEAVVREFGPYFFSSQPAWMLAYAITLKPQAIGLFGLDMAARSEYAHQKPDIMHFMWLAEQRGIDVMAPPESEILSPRPLYGYSMNTAMGRKLRTRQIEIDGEIARMEGELSQLNAKLMHFRGVRDDLDWTQQTWTGGLVKPELSMVHIKQAPPVLRAVADQES